MVESCVVIALLCLILFGILQVSYVVAARNVLNYSAIAAVRAASVGLNEFMLHKVARYAGIPAAGPVGTPSEFGREKLRGNSVGAMWDNAIARDQSPKSALGTYEIAVKEAYHMAPPRAFQLILDYENWRLDETRIHIEHEIGPDNLITLELEQTVPLVLPFSHVFFGHLDPVDAKRGAHVGTYPGKRITATAVVEDHSRHYLKNN